MTRRDWVEEKFHLLNSEWIEQNSDDLKGDDAFCVPQSLSHSNQWTFSLWRRWYHFMTETWLKESLRCSVFQKCWKFWSKDCPQTNFSYLWVVWVDVYVLLEFSDLLSDGGGYAQDTGLSSNVILSFRVAEISHSLLHNLTNLEKWKLKDVIFYFNVSMMKMRIWFSLNFSVILTVETFWIHQISQLKIAFVDRKNAKNAVQKRKKWR